MMAKENKVNNDIETSFEQDYPLDGDEYVGSMYDVYKKGYEAANRYADMLNKEVDILHELVTELYNIEVCVPAIRLTLQRIKNIKP